MFFTSCAWDHENTNLTFSNRSIASFHEKNYFVNLSGQVTFLNKINSENLYLFIDFKDKYLD